MFSSPLPASWLKKKVLLGASGFIAVVAAFLVFGVGNTPSYVRNGIPVPFIQQGTVLHGKVTFFTKRNNIDVYSVTFNNSEVKETLMPDNIYLVHIPNDSTITASPIDLAMSLSGTLNHNADYYGYRYSDAAATIERRDIAAVRFKDRFPAQFFASAKARASDASHGNALARFEADNNVVFLATDSATGSVRIDPAGALYVIIANEAGGIDINPRSLAVCGDEVVTGSEECDDGNVENADACTNQCTHGFPIPFGSGSTTGSGIYSIRLRGRIVDQVTGDAVSGATLQSAYEFTPHNMRTDSEGRFDFTATTDFIITEGQDIGESDDGGGWAFYKDCYDYAQLSLQRTATGMILTSYLFDHNLTSVDIDNSMDVQNINLKLYPAAHLKTVNDTEVAWDILYHYKNLSGMNGAGVSNFALEHQLSNVLPVDYDATVRFMDQQEHVFSSPLFHVPADAMCKTLQLTTTNGQTVLSMCGNSVVEGPEACDDGDTDAGDGCSSTCTVEPGYFCDNATPNVCMRVAPPIICGNGVIESGETCDDGDTDSGDGCSNVCVKEDNFRCTGEPSVCISYLEYVKDLADTNNNDVISDNEALLLTLNVAEAPDKPYDTVSQYDMDQDGDTDNTDIGMILTELDILAP